jgi:urease accessory protein
MAARPENMLTESASPAGFGDGGLALLRLLQLFDSQFPVGAFAHSSGVETYAALGGAVPELRQILQAQIELGWGRSELAAAHLAWQAAAEKGDRSLFEKGDRSLFPKSGSEKGTCPLFLVARRVDAMKVVPAVRSFSVGLGRRTLQLLQRVYPAAAVEVDPPHHAVVIGAAARRLGIEAPALLLGFAQSLAMGTLTAAIRCMPVGPAPGQELLIEAHPWISAAVERALADPEGSLFTCTPALDIRSHQQAHLHTRLFQT